MNVAEVQNERKIIANRKAKLMPNLKEAQVNYDDAINKDPQHFSETDVSRWRLEMRHLESKLAELEERDTALMAKLPGEKQRAKADKQREKLLSSIEKDLEPFQRAWDELVAAVQGVEDKARAFHEKRVSFRTRIAEVQRLEKEFLLEPSRAQEPNIDHDESGRVSLQVSLVRDVLRGHLDDATDGALRGERN